MSIFTKLREGIFRVRVEPKPDIEDQTTITNKRDTVNSRMNQAMEEGKRIDLTDLLNITTLKGNRNKKYEAFEEMVQDGRVGAAMEMYANDSVQYNSDGKIIWAESSDGDTSAYVNKLLEDLNVAKNIWSWAYCLIIYGDVYLETFMDTSTLRRKPTLLLEPNKINPDIRMQKSIMGAKLLRYIEKVPNPADIYDLQYKGKTAGFVKSDEELQNSLNNNIYTYSGMVTKLNILNPTKYVHICLSPNINRFPEKFKLINDSNIEEVTEEGYIDGSESQGSESLTYTVRSGQSVLENVYGAYQTLKLKEESVLLERVTKSSITRVIQVELGDMPESQKRKKLQEIKNQIEQQIQINKQTGTIQSRAGAQPIENILYTTTKNGKGTISTVNIGGDADVGNLDDVEQSENKLYGSLLIPKALLGADMDGSGLSNGGSLTEMNTTYARRIKRIQVALQSGIETLVNIFAISEGLDQHVNNFTIRLTPIITVEDNRRDELLQNKIRNVNDILSLMSNMDSITEDIKLEMLIEWLSTYLNQQDIVEIINKHLQEMENQENEEKTDKVEDALDDAEDNFTGGDFTDFESGPDFAPESNVGEEVEEENGEPEMAPQEDLAEIEGQDLL